MDEVNQLEIELINSLLIYMLKNQVLILAGLFLLK